MKLLSLLTATAITSNIFAADQSTALVVQDDFDQQHKADIAYKEKSSAATYYDLLPTPTHITWPPAKEEIRLHQLFSLDTGHTDIDDRAHDLTQLLLKDQDSIGRFRKLDENLQIEAAVDVHKLATTISLDVEAFKKRCEALLSGTVTRLLLESDGASTDDGLAVAVAPAPISTDDNGN